MSRFLLDANVLIASVFGDHVHFERADAWLADADLVAVCPIVEGALIRFALRLGETGRAAAELLDRVRANPRCEFWADDISYGALDIPTLTGHRQVTDTYLVALAASRRARLATFDQALVMAHPESTLLVP